VSLLTKLARLLGKKETVELDDPVFAKLRFDDVSLWQGQMPFAPLGQRVWVTIVGDCSGPSEEQRQWMREIVNRFDSIQQIVADKVLPEFERWGHSADRDTITAELKSTPSFVIRNPNSGKRDWSVSFMSNELDHEVIVDFLDWEPVGDVLLEG
jgi:hypothetical protein